MTEYDNQNRGAIWKNDRKENEKQPDFTGTLDVGGVAYYVSAWKRKEGASPNAPALSFAIKLKEQSPQQAAQPNDYAAPQEDFDDSTIPF